MQIEFAEYAKSKLNGNLLPSSSAINFVEKIVSSSKFNSSDARLISITSFTGLKPIFLKLY